MRRLKKKVKLLRGLIDGEAAYTGPFFITLDVTRRCNNRCLGCFFHCSQGRKPTPGNHEVKDLSFELIHKIRRELSEIGTQEVILFAEGEPFLHPGLIDFISAFKQADFAVQVFTNGTLIDQQTASRLVKSGLDILNVTMWAVNTQEHQSCHPGMSLILHEKRLEGLKLLTQARQQLDKRFPLLNLHFPINVHNYLNIKGRVELAQATGCDSVNFECFRDWGGEFEGLCLSPEDITRILGDLMSAKKLFDSKGVSHNIKEYIDRARLGARAWHKIPCYAGWFQCHVKVDGTVLACGRCRVKMGNLAEQRFSEIWNGPEFRQFRGLTSNFKGLESLSQFCDCANCSLVKDNVRVHRVFRWISPLFSSMNLRENTKGSKQNDFQCLPSAQSGYHTEDQL